ncbi:MAG: DUF5615 family PIN-like protein [Rickettsiales bacterium]
MKLLLDQNLSRFLLDDLCTIWKESTHVHILGMEQASDKKIWDFAAKTGYILVSKDNDFVRMATLFGAPPKVIFLSMGNATTDDIKHCLVKHKDTINEFYNNVTESLLIIS